MRRVRERLNERLAEIEAETDVLAARLERVGALISPPPGDGPRLCVLTVRAADRLTLPAAPNDEARQLAANLLGWLARFASQAKADGELPPGAEPESVAAFLLAAVQGALLLERTGPPGIAGRALRHALSSVSGQEKQT